MKFILPQARFAAIVVQELRDEVLVCDTKNNQVFCLNQTAGEVWKLCDGKTEVKEIAKILSKRLETNFSEELILFTLDELSSRNLLASKFSDDKKISALSRREIVKRIGLGSMIALPIISAVVMPLATQAQSGCFAPTVACDVNDDCCNNCCSALVCQDGLLQNGQACVTGDQCCSEFCAAGICSPGV